VDVDLSVALASADVVPPSLKRIFSNVLFLCRNCAILRIYDGSLWQKTRIMEGWMNGGSDKWKDRQQETKACISFDIIY